MEAPRRERDVVVSEPEGSNAAGLILAVVGVVAVVVLLFVLVGRGGDGVEGVPEEDVGDATAEVEVDADPDGGRGCG